MKVKTSISINTEVLTAVKKIAQQQDRSVSYIIEKFIEQKVKEWRETQAQEAAPRRNIKYSQGAKKRSSE